MMRCLRWSAVSRWHGQQRAITVAAYQTGPRDTTGLRVTRPKSPYIEWLNNVGTKASWSVQNIPSPSGGGLLDSVSCTVASVCTAVGFSGTEQGTLGERWNGTFWAIQSIPNPSGALKVDLSGVSCTSASACTAVGSEQTSSNQFTLAGRWNGRAWTIQGTPNPPGSTNSELMALSCSSASACTAVGFSDTSTLAEEWNGTAWTIQGTPKPSGSTNSELDGVSCSSASACTAVGWYQTSTGQFGLAERWTGAAWTIQSTPLPGAGDSPTLLGVSCISASACTAVGDYQTSSDEFTLAERWNGTACKIQSTPKPSGSSASELDGAFCSSASTCTAVGWYTSHNQEVPLAEKESG